MKVPKSDYFIFKYLNSKYIHTALKHIFKNMQPALQYITKELLCISAI